jgi:hypothetical protein
MLRPDRDTNAGPGGSPAVRAPHFTMDTEIGTHGKTTSRMRDERGQAVTEFALVLPLLVALVFVFVSFGKALYYYIRAQRHYEPPRRRHEPNALCLQSVRREQ